MESNNTKKNKNSVLITTIFCVFSLGLVVFFSYQMNARAETSSVGSGQSKDPVSTTLGATVSNEQLVMDMQFLQSLSLLNQIKIDSSFFTNKNFKNFKDNTVTLTPLEPGRPNPFAPIGIVGPISFPINPRLSSATPTLPTSTTITTPTASTTTTPEIISVETYPPSKIWTKTADLSGKVINTKDGLSVYFEYGSTVDLGQLTTPSKPGKDGIFIINIRGLTSKTMYYYRAATKINDTQTLYGKVVTFETK